MKFEKINIGSAKLISKAVASAGWTSCQLSAVSLFCYAEKYKTEVCFSAGFAFVKQNRPCLCYFLPIPLEGFDDCKFDESIRAILEHHRRHGCGDFVLWGVADDMLMSDVLKRNGLTAKPPDRDWAEYIHLSENIVNLKGKRFHAKRNSVNQFISANRDYCYVPLDGSNIHEAVDFQARLLSQARKNNLETIESLEEENVAMLRGFRHFEDLNLAGGIIRINGEICAFGFGSMINSDTFDLAFEKALKNYNGIYQVLEQEMFKGNINVKYVNRQEDLGIEGLRFAKQRLRPDILLHKRSFF